MADDISIFVKVVGQKEIVSTTNSLNKLETGVKRLSKDLSKGRIDSAQYATGLKELRRGVDKSFGSWQKAKTAVDQYSKELKQATAEQARAQAAIKAETAALKQYRQARRDATAENARYDAEQRKATKTARDAAKANQNLRMSYKQGHAAQVTFRAEQMRITSAQRKGIITTEEQKEAMQRLSAAMTAGTGSFARLGGAAQVGGRAVNSSGMLIQQAGYQFGDFAVQVQGGTNFMVAFGQQATQMIGAFNMLPAATLAASKSIFGLRISVVALIASLGVIIPVLTAIGAYFMRAREAANAGAEGIRTYADEAKDARSEIEKTRKEIDALNKGFRDTGELSLSLGIQQATKDLMEARTAFEVARGAQQQEQGFSPRAGAAPRLVTAIPAIAEAQAEVTAREKILRLLLEQRATQEAITRGMEDREDMLEREVQLVEDRRDAVEAIKSTMAEETLAMGNRLELLQTEIQYGKESAELAKVVAEQAREKYETDMMSEGILGNNLRLLMEQYDAVVATADEATRMAASIALANLNLTNMQSSMQYGGRGGDPRGVPDYENELGYKTVEQLIAEMTKTAGTTGGGGTAQKTPAELAAEAVAKLQEQLNLQRELIGMTEEEAHVRQSLGDYYSEVHPDTINALREQYTETQKLLDLQKQQETIANTVANSFANAYTSMIDGTMSVKDAFKNMAREIIKQLWEIFVVEQLVASVKGAMGGGGGIGQSIINMFQADGGAWSNGVQMFANGGVVNSPTMFGHSGGLGVMGEAGPEAIMPLKRGSNGKLGVQMEGGGGGDTINVVQNFSFSANGDESVKRIIAQAAPKIAQMTKSSLLDDRRRGGATKAAFG